MVTIMFRPKILLIGAMLVLSQAVSAAASPFEDLMLRRISYYYFSGDYLAALSLYRKTIEDYPSAFSRDQDKFFAARLYHQYGLSEEAATVYQVLVRSAGEPSTRAHSSFYLGQMAYEKNDWNHTVKYLRLPEKYLQSDENQHRLYMMLNSYLSQRDFATAATLLKQMDTHSAWYHYARFNLGVSHLAINDRRAGLQYLQDLTNLTSLVNARRVENFGDDLFDFQDKVNTALGFYFLKRKETGAAIEHFERVRLEGAFAEKSLLGLGWSYLERRKYEDALKPWTALMGMDRFHPTVQESMLALPYALQKLSASQQAMKSYQQAIDVYNGLEQSLLQVRDSIEKNAWISYFDNIDAAKPEQIVRNLGASQNDATAKFLLSVYEEPEFSALIGQYLEVLRLRQHLQAWQKRITMVKAMNPAMGTMQPAPGKPAAVADSRQLARVVSEYNALKQAVNDLQSNQDFRIVATEEEKRRLQSYVEAERKMMSYPANVRERMFRRNRDRYDRLAATLRKRFDEQLQSMKNDLVQMQPLIEVSRSQLGGASKTQVQTITAIRSVDAMGLAESHRKVTEQITIAQALQQDIQQQLRDLLNKQLRNDRRLLATYASQARFAMAQIVDKSGRGFAQQ